MRAKVGDPPRTMAEKVLWARGPAGEVRVDQVVLARTPAAVLSSTREGVKTKVEIAVAYEPTVVSDAEHCAEPLAGAALSRGVVVARAGVGFPAMVHLERFASPGRLCVTDEPRLAGVGGAGMLSFVVTPEQLASALATGKLSLPAPSSVQVSLVGKLRPFVCARDVALELVRRGLREVVDEVAARRRAPVVLEIAGPSARLLSVSERAVLCSVAPRLGAAAVLFGGDERTDVFLRDQRRSKAHRALSSDAGAPFEEVVSLDLTAVDPLALDADGSVRAVRDVGAKAVTQVVLGGDSGVTLRDLLAAATLLKSKRVHRRVDLLLAVPSRQMLEVLAATGALGDLVATGARLVEPDARVLGGALYPPHASGASLRTFDPPVNGANAAKGAIVASAETLAWAAATGVVGDPRGFKRPVRVTVPRTLPTDDVLIYRK